MAGQFGQDILYIRGDRSGVYQPGQFLFTDGMIMDDVGDPLLGTVRPVLPRWLRGISWSQRCRGSMPMPGARKLALICRGPSFLR